MRVPLTWPVDHLPDRPRAARRVNEAARDIPADEADDLDVDQLRSREVLCCSQSIKSHRGVRSRGEHLVKHRRIDDD
jgi:hypothetical protein